MSRHQGHVFRPQSCLLLQYYYNWCYFFIQTPRPMYFSNFVWSLRLYYFVASSSSRSYTIVACSALFMKNKNNQASWKPYLCAAGLVPNPSLFSATTVTGSSSTEDKEGREAHGWGGGQELLDTLFWKFPPPLYPKDYRTNETISQVL